MNDYTFLLSPIQIEKKIRTDKRKIWNKENLN